MDARPAEHSQAALTNAVERGGGYDVRDLSISARHADDAAADGARAIHLQGLIEQAQAMEDALRADLERAQSLDARTVEAAGQLHEGLLLSVKMLQALREEVQRAERAKHTLEQSVREHDAAPGAHS